MSDMKHDILQLVEKYSQPKPEFIPGTSPIPVSGKVYDSSDVSLLIESALDFWLTTGRFNDEFEAKLADFMGVKTALTVNSGSSANLVAFSALTSHLLKDRRIQPGDEVITVAAGFPTTVNPIIQHGCVPVFIDVDIPTYNIDASAIEAAITPKTKAIMIAHALGNPFDLGVVRQLCDKHNLWLVEDCCDALGATFDGKNVGTYGDIATLSFYPAHHITMGEGGAVLMSHPMIKKAALSIRDWGRDCWCPPGQDNTCLARFKWTLGDLPTGYDHKYIYSHLGYNLKITDMQAAVGVGQLGHLPDFIAKRRENFSYLKTQLAALEDKLILPEATPNSEPSWFGFPITLREDQGCSREELLLFLNERKIGTRLLFGGNLVKQPYMKDRNYRVHGELTRTETIMTRTFWIGVYPGLTEAMLAYVVKSFHEFFESC